MSALLQIKNLDVIARASSGESKQILYKANLTVAEGEVVALIGESGAGKSTLALAAMGYFRPNLKMTGGSLRFDGLDIAALDHQGRAQIRGRQIAYVPQSPSSALNPSLTIGRQIAEPMRKHGLYRKQEAEKRAEALLAELQIRNPAEMAARYPHQASGGQQQRIMLAMSMACAPRLLILDEPTTALDVTTQIDVLHAIKETIRKSAAAAIYVSHDLAVVAQIANRILVMKDGHIVEEADTDSILHRPQNDYTRTLIKAVDRKGAPRQPMAQADARAPIMTISNIAATYRKRKWLDRSSTSELILRDVNFEVFPKEVLAIVGESGSGKTTLARVIAGLHAPAHGAIRFAGEALAATHHRRTKEQLRRIQIVFQSPEQSLNPQVTVGETIDRALKFYFGLSTSERRARTAKLLEEVDLPANYALRYPAALSGGQRQRVSIARALAAEPDIILCDEILSALDVVVAGRIIELLKRLQESREVAYVFISHDLTTVRSINDRVGVMYAGRLLEVGNTRDVFTAPHHPYAELLIRSVPEMTRGWLENTARSSIISNAIHATTQLRDDLCVFRNRCPFMISGLCDRKPPPERVLPDHHRLLCHLNADALNEVGASPPRT